MKITDTKLGEMNRFWNESPSQVVRSSLPVGSPEFFADIEKKRYFLEPHIKPFAQFEAWRGKKVLEIGCGMGTDTMQFVRAGALVTGVDYSQSSLDLLAARARQEGRMVRLVHANAEELSKTLPPETYDLIYSFGVLHHTPHPERAYREITKYMGPHSVLKLMVYHSFSLKSFFVMLQHGPRNWRKKVEYYSEHVEGSPVTYIYTKKEITDLLNQCGLRVDSIAVRYLWMRWYLKWMPKPLLKLVERTLGWNICIDASLQPAA